MSKIAIPIACLILMHSLACSVESTASSFPTKTFFSSPLLDIPAYSMKVAGQDVRPFGFFSGYLYSPPCSISDISCASRISGYVGLSNPLATDNGKVEKDEKKCERCSSRYIQIEDSESRKVLFRARSDHGGFSCTSEDCFAQEVIDGKQIAIDRDYDIERSDNAKNCFYYEIQEIFLATFSREHLYTLQACFDKPGQGQKTHK
jgi:hypothetical protein